MNEVVYISRDNGGAYDPCYYEIWSKPPVKFESCWYSDTKCGVHTRIADSISVRAFNKVTGLNLRKGQCAAIKLHLGKLGFIKGVNDV